MSWLDGLKHRIRTVIRPAAHARDVADEMQFHVEMDTENEGAAGAPRRFGNRTYYREEVRRRTWIGLVDVLRQDLTYAWRTTRRSPGFTAVVVLTLALGIGVNAAAFSILDRFYLRPPAGVADPGTIRRMWIEHFRTSTGEPFKGQSVSYRTFDAIANATGARADMALFATDYAMRLGRRPTDPRVGVVFASANYFEVLGVRPGLGRFFTRDEDRIGEKGSVAVVSHAFWKNRLAGDTSALGRRIAIGPDSFTVVGVADRRFIGLDLRAAEVWAPLGSMSVGWAGPQWWTNDNVNPFNVIRRATPTLGDAEFNRRATAVVQELNRQKGTLGDTLQTVWSGPVLEARGPVRQGQDMIISTRLGGVALIVLLIAGANVVNLLLSRASQRRREIAVRLALGVSRRRLIAMLTTETMVVAGLAGIAAFFAGWWGASVLRTLLMPNIRQWSEPAVDGRVLAFTVVIAMVAGIVAGVIPALQASNPRLTSALKAGAREGVRHRSRLRNTLVIMQAALSVVLLVGAALFVRSLHNVQGLDIGFDSDRLIFGRVEFADGEKPPRPVFLAQMRDLAARLRGRPGIEAVTRAAMEPMQGFNMIDFFVGADSSATFGRRMPLASVVSPSFFDVVGLRMLRGRGFSGGDVESGPAELVVNDAMAKLVWPGRDPLGECVRLEQRNSVCYTVVGVVETARLGRVIEPEETAQFYVPLGSQPTPDRFGGQLIVRARADFALTAGTELRNMLKGTFPTAEPVITPMTENLEPEYRPWRLGATLFTGLGALALAVAMLGIYSTVAYGVTQRTHEFGVRIALGARVSDVLRQVVGEGIRTVAVGVGLGLALAIAAGQLIEALLYGIAPRNPIVLGLVSVSLLLVAVVAALVPAWRASRADPITALRAD